LFPRGIWPLLFLLFLLRTPVLRPLLHPAYDAVSPLLLLALFAFLLVFWAPNLPNVLRAVHKRHLENDSFAFAFVATAAAHRTRVAHPVSPPPKCVARVLLPLPPSFCLLSRTGVFSLSFLSRLPITFNPSPPFFSNSQPPRRYEKPDFGWRKIQRNRSRKRE